MRFRVSIESERIERERVRGSREIAYWGWSLILPAYNYFDSATQFGDICHATERHVNGNQTPGEAKIQTGGVKRSNIPACEPPWCVRGMILLCINTLSIPGGWQSARAHSITAKG